MGMWNTHGMIDDPEDQKLACDMLALMPDELMALSDYNDMQAWIYTQMRKSTRGQKKRKHTLMIGHFQRRARRFKELAAMTEHEYSPNREEFEIERLDG